MLGLKHLRDLFGGTIPAAEVLRGVASGLAKMGVKVQISSSCTCPMADNKKKIIHLPSTIKTEKALSVVSWWVDHEAAHLIWSHPPDGEEGVRKLFVKVGKVFEAHERVLTYKVLKMCFGVLNQVEDARIEHLMANEFPGCIKNFIAGPAAAGLDQLAENIVKEMLSGERPPNPFLIAGLYAFGLLDGWHKTKSRQYMREFTPEDFNWVLDIADKYFLDIKDVAKIAEKDLVGRVDSLLADIFDKLLSTMPPDDDDDDEGEHPSKYKKKKKGKGETSKTGRKSKRKAGGSSEPEDTTTDDDDDGSDDDDDEDDDFEDAAEGGDEEDDDDGAEKKKDADDGEGGDKKDDSESEDEVAGTDEEEEKEEALADEELDKLCDEGVLDKEALVKKCLAETKPKDHVSAGEMPQAYYDNIDPKVKELIVTDYSSFDAPDEKYLVGIQNMVPTNLGAVGRRLTGKFRDTIGSAYAGNKINPHKHQQIVAGTAFGKPVMLRRNQARDSKRGVAVQLIVDCTGSMGCCVGAPTLRTALSRAGRGTYYLTRLGVSQAAVIGLTQYFASVKVPLEVLGYSAARGESLGSISRSLVCSRWVDVFNFVFKDFSDSMSTLRTNLLCVQNGGKIDRRHVGMGDNCDMDSLFWAAGRLMTREEEKKIMLVFSDGGVGDGGDSALQNKFMKWGVQRIARAGIRIGGFGFETLDVEKFYPTTVILDRSELNACVDLQSLGFLVQEKILQLFEALLSKG